VFGFGAKSRMVSPQQALPGHPEPVFEVGDTHAVLATSLRGPWPGTESIYLAMGCFWGAEELYWQLPGVVCTSVGYQGGFSPNPTYEEVCTGMTGHAEVVHVAYDPELVPTYDILKVFWENHDPTQGMRQGNDVGTQYRSAVYATTDDQRLLAEATLRAYEAVITARGYPAITTELSMASEHPYYLAESIHQQYLAKVPHGYRCHANTGLALPGPDQIRSSTG
jgi:peptide-methionine (S)-S-oxide reductase